MSRTRVVLAVLAAVTPAALHAQQKFKLTYHPPTGESIRYHDHYEMWITFGSDADNRPNLVVDIFKTEIANVRGDTVIFDAKVDSARAEAPLGGVPPEFSQQATLMRGSREIVRVTENGKELSDEQHGVTVGDLFRILLGPSNASDQQTQREYKQWRTLPSDSVSQGAGWDDSVRIRYDSVEWRGRVQYRLRRVDRRDGVAVGRIEARGRLDPSLRAIDPEYVDSQADVDLETGRLIRADSHQQDGFEVDRLSVTFRGSWHTERMH